MIKYWLTLELKLLYVYCQFYIFSLNEMDKTNNWWKIFKNTAFYLISIFLHMVWIQKYTYSHHIETRAQQSKSFDSFWHDGNTYTPVFSPQQEFTSHIKLRFLSVSSFKCFMQCSAIFSNCAGRLIKKQRQF